MSAECESRVSINSSNLSSLAKRIDQFNSIQSSDIIDQFNSNYKNWSILFQFRRVPGGCVGLIVILVVTTKLRGRRGGVKRQNTPKFSSGGVRWVAANSTSPKFNNWQRKSALFQSIELYRNLLCQRYQLHLFSLCYGIGIRNQALYKPAIACKGDGGGGGDDRGVYYVQG